MSQIILAQEKIKLYSWLQEICEVVRYEASWRDRFWNKLLLQPGIYQEFLHYAETNDFLCKCQIDGYYITDIFIWEMRKYNVRTDRGKNGEDCDKYAMLLEAFDTMLEMVDNGARVDWSMEMKTGMDQL